MLGGVGVQDETVRRGLATVAVDRGMIWVVTDAMGSLVALVHSSGEVCFYLESPSVLAESLVNTLEKWPSGDRDERGMSQQIRESLFPSLR